MLLLTKKNRKDLPSLYANEEKDETEVMAIVKFFTPDSNWTWYATEFDGDDTFFGFVVGPFPELGPFSLSELKAARGPWGLPIERDLWFKPTSLEELKKKHAATY